MARDVGVRRDEADEFVHAATKAYALGGTSPVPPTDAAWIPRAVEAGVLSPISFILSRDGGATSPEISNLRRSVALRHLRTLQDLALVRGVLNGAGLPWAVVKGPVLASVVFAQPQVRDYTDLDLLVSPRDVSAVIEALVSAGSELHPTDWDAVIRARTAELTLVLPAGTLLDLHWSLLNRGTVRDGYSLDTDDLLRRRVERRIDGLVTPTLDDLDLVLHVLLHACLSGASSLRWLLDVQQCLKWLDATPTEFAARARERSVEVPTRAIIEAAATHLDPSLDRWSAELPNNVWCSILRSVSRRRPPSLSSGTHRSPKSFFAATRSTSAASLRALVRIGVLRARYARSGWPEPSPHHVELTDPGLASWLEIAATESSQAR